jgi:hypothetical protein
LNIIHGACFEKTTMGFVHVSVKAMNTHEKKVGCSMLLLYRVMKRSISYLASSAMTGDGSSDRAFSKARKECVQISIMDGLSFGMKCTKLERAHQGDTFRPKKETALWDPVASKAARDHGKKAEQ